MGSPRECTRILGLEGFRVERIEWAGDGLDAGVALGEADLLGANPTRPTPDAALRVDQRHAVRRPGQIVPRARLGIPQAPRASSTPAACIAADAAPFDPDPQPAARAIGLPLESFYAITVQTQNPSTLASRSHVSSLLCGNTERTPSAAPMASGIGFRCPGRRADRPPQERSA